MNMGASLKIGPRSILLSLLIGCWVLLGGCFRLLSPLRSLPLTRRSPPVASSAFNNKEGRVGVGPAESGPLSRRTPATWDEIKKEWPVMRLNKEDNEDFKSEDLQEISGAGEQGRNWAARFMEWLIARSMRARSQFVSGLSVRVNGRKNRNILRGRVDSIAISFDRIAYGQIWCTGGGSVYIKGLNLRMRRFLFQDLQSLRTPYDIYGDFLLTQSDIINSKFIRNVIQHLVNIVIKRALKLSREVLDCEIKRVTIRGKRIYIYGEADVGKGGAIMPFEISTGVGVREGGQVVYLRDLNFCLNPESVLRTEVPVITTSVIDVDIGEDCWLDSFEIADRHVRIKAHSSISPLVRFEVAPADSRGRFRYDMGAVLSNIMKFSDRAIFGPSPPAAQQRQRERQRELARRKRQRQQRGRDGGQRADRSRGRGGRSR